MGFTLKLELVRLGKPLRLRLTLPVKPPEGVSVMVSILVELTATLMVVESAPRVKSGFVGTLTVRDTFVVWLKLPLVPVMVNG